MQSKEFTSGKFEHKFNKDQVDGLEPILDYLSKIGISNSRCNEEVGEESYYTEVGEYNGSNEIYIESFFLDFEF